MLWKVVGTILASKCSEWPRSLRIIVCVLCLFASVVSHFLWLQGPRPTGLLCPWDSPGKNTGVGCHALFQGIFPVLGLNPHLLCLLHCRQILYHWAPRGAQWESSHRNQPAQSQSFLIMSPVPSLSSLVSFHPHSFLYPIFDLPPTVLLIYPNLLSHSSPHPPSPFPSLGREAELEWGQASVFQTAGHDTLVGREINLVGHGINLKGHDQNVFLNGIEENQIE